MTGSLLLEAIRQTAGLTLFAALALGSVLGLVVGLWLLASPASFFAATAGWNRWISMRPALKPLETPLLWERYFYRHHKLFGTLLLLAAGYFAGYFWLAYNRTATLRYWPADWSWFVDASVFLLRVASLIVAAVGLLVLVRPSLLKASEARANRWVSTRRWLRPLEITRPATERLAQAHPRWAGLLITALSLYSLAGLTLIALRRLSGK